MPVEHQKSLWHHSLNFITELFFIKSCRVISKTQRHLWSKENLLKSICSSHKSKLNKGKLIAWLSYLLNWLFLRSNSTIELVHFHRTWLSSKHYISYIFEYLIILEWWWVIHMVCEERPKQVYMYLHRKTRLFVQICHWFYIPHNFNNPLRLLPH